MTGLIRIADAARIGPALGQIRTLLGYSRAELAQLIADATGRNPKSVANQLAEWDRLENCPTARTLGPALNALGYDLALIPREDDEPYGRKHPGDDDDVTSETSDSDGWGRA
jgi:hypothetical protein